MNPSLELGPDPALAAPPQGDVLAAGARGRARLRHAGAHAAHRALLLSACTSARPGLPEDELVVARRRFLHPRDAAAARGGGARGSGGARPQPARRRRRSTRRRSRTRARFPIGARAARRRARAARRWPVRATPGIAAALGLQVVAGTGLDAVSGAPDARGDDAGPADLRPPPRQLFGTAGDAVGKDVRRQQLRTRPGGRAWCATSPSGAAGCPPRRRSWSWRRSRSPNTSSCTSCAPPAASRAAVIEAATRAARRHRRRRLDDRDQGAGTAHDALRDHLARARWSSRSGRGSWSSPSRWPARWRWPRFRSPSGRRQIGVRRALGASRGEIVRYFLLENLILTGFGLGLGLGLAVALNQVLRRIMADLMLTPRARADLDGDLHRAPGCCRRWCRPGAPPRFLLGPRRERCDHGGAVKVLIADDQPAVCAALELLFELHGLPSIVVNRPDEALDLIATEDIGAVVQDMNFTAGEDLAARRASRCSARSRSSTRICPSC